MTPEEKESLMTFVLRHANLNVLDYVVGDGIFDRVAEEKLRKADKDYLYFLARQEEVEVRGDLKKNPSPAFSKKLNRFLKNIETVKKVLA
jgi:hypothetical protein